MKNKPVWNKGLTKETDDRVLKQSIKLKGKVFSKAHCKKISESKTCPWCEAKRGNGKGKNNPFYNRHHTEKTKQILRENHSHPKTKNIHITKEAKNVLNGLMLGDGHMERNNQSGRYTQGCKYKEFLEHIQTVLPFEWTPLWHDKKWDCYHMKSHSSPTLLKIGKKWYNGKKIVPNDIELTPKCVLYWYLSDGGLTFSNKKKFPKSKYYKIMFATEGFEIEDCILLAEKLKKIGINCNVLKSKRIGIHSDSKETLLRYIGKSPVGCYEYKWGNFFE